ncbi:MAG: hypothetical protein RQ724_09760, partial [Desulfuromonadales bacterium]|nr:hypothetical protein [Desulfuromonadales bacterium]
RDHWAEVCEEAELSPVDKFYLTLRPSKTNRDTSVADILTFRANKKAAPLSSTASTASIFPPDPGPFQTLDRLMFTHPNPFPPVTQEKYQQKTSPVNLT